MIYIHSLKDLTPKTAEVESVQIIRNIKSNPKVNLSRERLSENFSQFFIDSADFILIENSSRLINPTISSIKELIMTNDPLYESINLVRAITMLEELDEPLIKNIEYLKEIESWQNQLLNDIIFIVSSLPNANTMDEKMKLNNEINNIFKKILRNDDFMFNSNGMINEGKFTRINDLYKSLKDGFFFHFTVKEHLDKSSFDAVKNRIPSTNAQRVDNITRDILEIKKGVDKTYDYNMNMIKLIVDFYSHIKLFIS